MYARDAGLPELAFQFALLEDDARHSMPTFSRPWDYWLTMIEVLRSAKPPDNLQATTFRQAKLGPTPADRALVQITCKDEMYLRSIFWASLQMGAERLEP
jgi:hypothetical protein